MVMVRGSSSGRPVMALLDLIGRRWALRILWELHQHPGASFRALQERCAQISPSVLNTRLRELRAAGIIELSDGYALSAAGVELSGLLMPLHYWAEAHMPLPDPPGPKFI
jgi:DNA-binding HxlR family transcriptional regulator